MSVKSDDPENMFAPPVNRAMHILDRSFFSKTIPLAAALILDRSQIHPTRQQLRHEALDLVRIYSIVQDPHSQHKALLLRPHVQAKDKTTWSEILNDLVQQEKISVIPYDLKLSYANWSYCKICLDWILWLLVLLMEPVDILKAIMPVQDELPTGFSIAGHVGRFSTLIVKQ